MFTRLFWERVIGVAKSLETAGSTQDRTILASLIPMEPRFQALVKTKHIQPQHKAKLTLMEPQLDLHVKTLPLGVTPQCQCHFGRSTTLNPHYHPPTISTISSHRHFFFMAAMDLPLAHSCTDQIGSRALRPLFSMWRRVTTGFLQEQMVSRCN